MQLAAVALLVACGGARPQAEQPAAAPTVIIAAGTAITLDVVVVAVLEAQPSHDPRELTRDVARAYADYVRATRMIPLQEARLRQLEDLAGAVRAHVAAGSAPVSDGTAIDGAIERVRLDGVAARDELRVAARRLNELLRQPEGAELAPPTDLAATWVIVGLEQLLAQAAIARGDQSARAEVTDAHQRLMDLVQAWAELGTDASDEHAEWLTAMMAMYRAGTRALTDVLTFAQGRWEHEASVLDLEHRVALASADLEHAVGVRLDRAPLSSE